MARSEYYGLKGSGAAEWQKKLNALGAKLKVDGVWGPRTEAAYQRYFAGASAAGAPYKPDDIQYIDYKPQPDEELLKQAELEGKELYDIKTENKKARADRQKEALLSAITNLDKEYGDKASVISQAFAKKRKELSDYALSRGMARSSYALKTLKDAEDEEISSQLDVLQQKQARANELQKNIDALEITLEEDLQEMDSERRKGIESILSKLKKERDAAVIEAVKYNNTLFMKQREYENKHRKSRKSGRSGRSRKSAAEKKQKLYSGGR